jgi:hypothetical protein
MSRRLEAIRATGRPRPVAELARRRQAMSALPVALARGPVPTARPGRGRAMRQFARKGILRLMRPYTAYQNSVDTLVFSALEDLSDGISAERRDHSSARADLLGELRGYEHIASALERQGRIIEQLDRRLTELERARDPSDRDSP